MPIQAKILNRDVYLLTESYKSQKKLQSNCHVFSTYSRV